MIWPWAVLAIALTLTWGGIAAALALMNRRLPFLPEVPPALAGGAPWPRVSVIVPARNEARAIETAMRSLLATDYPALEIVAIDDRSEDETGAILDRLARQDARLVVVRVETLPAGWLGKTHACHLGAGRASGEWLLFTDGDVWFAPGALCRSMAFALRHRLGHLVAFPTLVAPGFGERAFQTAFAALLSLKFQTWALARPGSGGFVGVGAFNLVEAAAYRRAGGHARLALEVVDDVKLGLVLRRSGVAQGAVDSGGMVRVRWQHGLGASFAGLIKNGFAGAEWSWARVAVGSAVLGALSLGPAVLAWGAPTPAIRLVATLVLAGTMAIHGAAARRLAGGSGLEGLAFPLCGLGLIAVLLTSAALATWRGGISWRGTLYPLAALRAGCVRESAWPSSGAVGWETSSS